VSFVDIFLKRYVTTLVDLKVDYTKGLAQSIGFKEFQPYLQLLSSLKHGEDVAATLDECKSQCVAKVKSATAQYARKQLQWIKVTGNLESGA